MKRADSRRIDVGASPTLRSWLDRGAGYDAEYAHGMSNHLPMALMALQRLGATEARLQAFAQTYVARLQPAPAATDWPVGEPWASRLGDRSAWAAYRQLFAQWLQMEDASDVLEAVLPRLMPGCAGAAFHGLIRTAYAVQSAHRQELADALAHWACVYLPVGPEPSLQNEAGPDRGHERNQGRRQDQSHERDPAAVLRALPLPGAPLPGRLIAERVAVVAALPGFAATAAQLKVDDDTLERLARGAAELYARSGNFTVLHLLTSSHALRMLLPYLGEPGAALCAYWPAFAAAWVASGAPDRGGVPLRPWARITAAAVSSDDDHAAKLVDSCREQQRAYGGEVWQLAASRLG